MSSRTLLTKASELGEVPAGWEILVSPGGGGMLSKQIYYRNIETQKTILDHPKLGPLPIPWVIRFCSTVDGNQVVRYVNPKTIQSQRKDPRWEPKILESKNSELKHSHHMIASYVHKMTGSDDMSTMHREEIGNKNERSQWDVLKVIDDGTIGAMNQGVLVVKRKGDDVLCVEKRFGGRYEQAKTEILMVRRAKHPSIMFYIAAFITPPVPNWQASLYVEYCDRGSLQDLIDKYVSHRRTENPNKIVPERFVWHALIGLCDGIAYLRGGRSYVDPDCQDYTPLPGWQPILHRDIKPDNILLKSRVAIGSPKYFYCVISDFGLACENLHPTNPRLDSSQRDGFPCGTVTHFAPEMLWDAYPKNPQQQNTLPYNGKHSEKTDLWSIGLCIYLLTMCASDAHLIPGWRERAAQLRIGLTTYARGTESRVKTLVAPKTYTQILRQVLHLMTIWDPAMRPDPINMVRILKESSRQAGFTSCIPVNEDEVIPPWATKDHSTFGNSLLCGMGLSGKDDTDFA